MNYNLTLFWNGKRVMDARCTAVVSYEMARAYMKGDFTGADSRDYIAYNFDAHGAQYSLDAILALCVGSIVKGDYTDGTGRADFTIERVA